MGKPPGSRGSCSLPFTCSSRSRSSSLPDSWMPNEFTLRLATPADAGILARAGAELFADTFGAENRPEDLAAYLSTAFSEEQQRRELEERGNRILLAIDAGGELSGYVHLRFG